MTVYFSCFSSSPVHTAELIECLSFIKNVCSDGHDTIIFGDMNFECIPSNVEFKLCDSVILLRCTPL